MSARLTCIAVLAMLALAFHAANDAHSDDVRATSQANSVEASDDTASIPDFDDDGTIGFGDFVKFAGKFGLSEGDDGYDAQYDLNGDAEIGFSDFVIFAQNFGKDAPSPAVAIPDANLRAAIEAALGKDSGAPITEAEMATLDSLDANDAGISDLAGLEFAVNLTYLSLNDNDINDISTLANLINLERLWLSNNGIKNISALAKLTKLTELWLWNNQIEDISALSSLTGLTRLSLGRNNLTDISALAGLTNLSMLILEGNSISDLSPLVANKGMNIGDTINLNHNPLDIASASTEIPALQARGVSVSLDGTRSVNEPQIYNENIFVLPVSEDLRSVSPPLKKYATVFYEHFRDEFDFLIFVRNTIAGADHVDVNVPYYYAGVKNEIRGIGQGIYSEAHKWGSSGRLQGGVLLVWIEFDESVSPPGEERRLFKGGVLLHELMHRWANFIIKPYSPHWGFSSANGVLGGFDLADLESHDNNQYTAGVWGGTAGTNKPARFSPIELYLAGFIPPEEVPDLWVAEDGEYVWDQKPVYVKSNEKGHFLFTASKIRTYAIEDIIAEHGPRIPDHTQSQKDFRAAVILLTDERHPVRRGVLKGLSDDVSWFSHAGDSGIELYLGVDQYNFHEAAGGRATITMDGLSQFQRRAGAKRVVPTGFGTPPPVVYLPH